MIIHMGICCICICKHTEISTRVYVDFHTQVDMSFSHECKMLYTVTRVGFFVLNRDIVKNLALLGHLEHTQRLKCISSPGGI